MDHSTNIEATGQDLIDSKSSSLESFPSFRLSEDAFSPSPERKKSPPKTLTRRFSDTSHSSCSSIMTDRQSESSYVIHIRDDKTHRTLNNKAQPVINDIVSLVAARHLFKEILEKVRFSQQKYVLTVVAQSIDQLENFKTVISSSNPKLSLQAPLPFDLWETNIIMYLWTVITAILSDTQQGSAWKHCLLQDQSIDKVALVSLFPACHTLFPHLQQVSNPHLFSDAMPAKASIKLIEALLVSFTRLGLTIILCKNGALQNQRTIRLFNKLLTSKRLPSLLVIEYTFWPLKQPPQIWKGIHRYVILSAPTPSNNNYFRLCGLSLKSTKAILKKEHHVLSTLPIAERQILACSALLGRQFPVSIATQALTTADHPINYWKSLLSTSKHVTPLPELLKHNKSSFMYFINKTTYQYFHLLENHSLLNQHQIYHLGRILLKYLGSIDGLTHSNNHESLVKVLALLSFGLGMPIIKKIPEQHVSEFITLVFLLKSYSHASLSAVHFKKIILEQALLLMQPALSSQSITKVMSLSLQCKLYDTFLKNRESLTEGHQQFMKFHQFHEKQAKFMLNDAKVLMEHQGRLDLALIHLKTGLQLLGMNLPEEIKQRHLDFERQSLNIQAIHNHLQSFTSSEKKHNIALAGLLMMVRIYFLQGHARAANFFMIYLLKQAIKIKEPTIELLLARLYYTSNLTSTIKKRKVMPWNLEACHPSTTNLPDKHQAVYQFLYATGMAHYYHDAKTVLNQLDHAFTSNFQAGYFSFAILAAVQRIFFNTTQGVSKNLEQTYNVWQFARTYTKNPYLEKLVQSMIFFYTRLQGQPISESGFSETPSQLLEQFHKGQHVQWALIHQLMQMILSYLHGDIQTAKQYAQYIEKQRMLFAGSFFLVIDCFFQYLILSKEYDVLQKANVLTNAFKSHQLRQQINGELSRMSAWYFQSKESTSVYYHFMLAHNHHIRQNLLLANKFYQQSIREARKHHHYLYQGIFLEYYADFCQQALGDPTTAEEHRHQAAKLFYQYGALVTYRRVLKKISTLLPETKRTLSLHQLPEMPNIQISLYSETAEKLDSLTSVIKNLITALNKNSQTKHIYFIDKMPQLDQTSVLTIGTHFNVATKGSKIPRMNVDVYKGLSCVFTSNATWYEEHDNEGFCYLPVKTRHKLWGVILIAGEKVIFSPENVIIFRSLCQQAADVLNQNQKKSNSRPTETQILISPELACTLKELLHGVVGNLEWLTQYPPSVTEKNPGEDAISCSQRIANIIDDALLFQRLQNDEFTFNPTAFNLEKAIHTLIEQNREVWGAQRKLPISVELHIDDTIPKIIIVDRILIDRILNRFIKNAIITVPYAKKITITVTAGKYQYSDEQLLLEFMITNFHQTTHSPQMKQLTIHRNKNKDTFRKSQESRRHLDTVICKKLLTLMEGTVEDTNQFRIIVSAQNYSPVMPCRKLSDTIPVKQWRVLILSHYNSSAQVLNRLLQMMHCRHISIIDNVRSIPTRKISTFSLALVNFSYPVQSSRFDTLEQLKAYGITCPIIAITADNTETFYNEAKKRGCNHCIIKPVTLANLTLVLENIHKPSLDVVAEHKTVFIKESDSTAPQQMTPPSPTIFHGVAYHSLFDARSSKSNKTTRSADSSPHIGLKKLGVPTSRSMPSSPTLFKDALFPSQTPSNSSDNSPIVHLTR